MSCRARDRLRQKEARPRSFVPAIGIEQEIMFSDDQAREYRSTMHNELGKRLGSDFRKRYWILRPEQMKLAIVEPSNMADQVRNSHSKLRVDKARQIAYVLKERLEEILAETESMPLQIGEVVPYRRRHPRNQYRDITMVGAYLFGWKGPKSSVATHDLNGDQQVLNVLSKTRAASTEIIAEGHGGISAAALAADPRIPVIQQKHNGKIPGDELAAISDAVQLSIPEGVQLSHPRLTIRTRTGRNGVEEINLDSAGSQASAFLSA